MYFDVSKINNEKKLWVCKEKFIRTGCGLNASPPHHRNCPDTILLSYTNEQNLNKTDVHLGSLELTLGTALGAIGGPEGGKNAASGWPETRTLRPDRLCKLTKGND